MSPQNNNPISSRGVSEETLFICCCLKIGMQKIFTGGADELCYRAWELLKLALLSKPGFSETTSSVFPDLLILDLLPYC